jgi:hypothetical protein
MQTRGIGKVLAGLIGLALCAGGARATDYTWYVDQNVVGGDGSGTSWANATTTITGAITKVDQWLDANWSGTRDGHASDSITIVVRAGTYVESVKPGANEGGTVTTLLKGSDTGSAPLYIQSEFWDTTGKLNTIVQTPPDPQSCFYMRAYVGAFGNWTVRGFTMRTDLTGATQNYRNGLLDIAGSGTVENNIIELVNAAGAAYMWTGIANAGDLIIRNNIIRKVDGQTNNARLTGVEFGSTNTIYNNLIALDTGDDRRLLEGKADADNNTIYRNIALGSSAGKADYALALPINGVTGTPDNNRVYANIFAYADFMLMMGTSSSTGDNNAFYNNTFYSGDRVKSYGSNDTFFNNLLVGSYTYAENVTFDGVGHSENNAVDAYGNYIRVPSDTTMFESTTLPTGWSDKLPSELSAGGWLRPKKSAPLPGIASHNGFNAAATDAYGVQYYSPPRIGGVSHEWPKGTAISIR